MLGGEGAVQSKLCGPRGGAGSCHPALMVKASPELSPVSLSFLGEETVLNSGREVSVEWEWLSSELAGL